jgi:hypothetical protein
MKTVYSIPQALPLTLPVGKIDARRQQVAGLRLEDAAVLAFNTQLQAVSSNVPPVDADQVASLARWFLDLSADKAEATIALRMARADALSQMLDDPDWQVPETTANRGRHLIAALRGSENLIPDATPRVGHLDEALMVELCWADFEAEVGDYLDFRRFRAEGNFRGTREELRTAWEADCVAAASQMLHRQQVRERGYSRPQRLEQPFRVC